MKAHEIFESVPCKRCGGEGRILTFSNVLGGICFKCKGCKYQFTARGQRDFEVYRAAVDAITLRPVSDVKPGDYVRSDNMRKYAKVISMTDPRRTGASIAKDGTETPTYHVDIKLDRAVWHDLGCPLSYRGDTFSFQVGRDIRIHAGDRMPKAESFVTRRKAAAPIRTEDIEDPNFGPDRQY